ncbi:MAG: LacI family DNA-binding transcriptional regulator [Verrucomicrobia bacterium]|nr:LacI family DNA-binding transcriptional regulator [Verrucomicrobiota bacterium]
MATIKDVAALAGVSYTTVSHVINKTRPVSKAAREEVEAAIRRLNYVPSAIARSLRHRSTATIGLLISNNTNPFFSELAHGIEDGCYQNGYSVILCNSDDDPAREQTYLQVLLQRRIDGLVVGSIGGQQTLARTLRRLLLPLVIVDRAVPGLRADLVQVDNELGGYLATRHLIELGHKGIGCVTGPTTAISSTDRLQGYQRALKESAISILPERIIASDFTSEGGYKAGALLLQNADVSAVMACNDLMGIGVLRCAAEKGIRVPEEFSVIGFDGIDLGRYVHPALTTIGQSIRELGRIAATTLIGRIGREGQGPFRRIVLPPEVVLRESTAALQLPSEQL